MASIHICIRDAIRTLGVEHSPISERHLMGSAVATNVLAGVAQGFGLALAFSRTRLESDSTNLLGRKGQYIAFSGFIMQAFSLALRLLLLVAIVLPRAVRAHRQFGYTTFHKDRGYVPLSSRTKIFIGVLPVAMLFVILRCAFRAAYLWIGLDSFLARDSEVGYIVGEGVLFMVALVTLTIFHPAIWLDDGKDGIRSSSGSGRGSRISICKEKDSDASGKESRMSRHDAEANLDEVSRLIFRTPEGAITQGHVTPSSTVYVTKLNHDTA